VKLVNGPNEIVLPQSQHSPQSVSSHRLRSNTRGSPSKEILRTHFSIHHYQKMSAFLSDRPKVAHFPSQTPGGKYARLSMASTDFMKVMALCGLLPCPNLSCLFYGHPIPGQPPLYLAVYVDDFVCFSHTFELTSLAQSNGISVFIFNGIVPVMTSLSTCLKKHIQPN
jgi:hypothetical protein